MPVKPKPPIWDFAFWVAIDQWGHPHGPTFASRRSEAMRKAVEMMAPLGDYRAWKDLYREGWRCVCVGLEPVRPEDRS